MFETFQIPQPGSTKPDDTRSGHSAGRDSRIVVIILSNDVEEGPEKFVCMSQSKTEVCRYQ